VKEKALAAIRRLNRDFLAFTPGQKAVTIIAVLGVAVGGYLFSNWASRTTYAPLYSNLAASDASAIVDKLTSAKEPYKLGNNGTEILVPKKDVYAQRLAMSSSGLPNSGQSGYSLLDHEGVTTSEFVEHVNYQRALAGELDNTIGSIQGVASAQVNLAIPQSDVFSDDSQKTTAGVLLTLTPGTTLSTDQVRSVVNLVSSSVPGLSANDVSVSDSTGKVLSAAGSGLSAASGLSTEAEQTQAYDARVSQSIQQMLDRIVGVGHSSVTVNALLDFDTGTTTSHSYTYSSGVPPLAVASQAESYSSNGSASAGVLGAGTPAPSTVPTGTAGNYASSSVTQNNAVGTVDKTTVAAPGSIQKLGVSVVLDKAAAGSLDESQVRDLVSLAFALDTDRGDSLAVATLPFDTTSATQAAAAAAAAKKAAAKAASSAQLMSLIKTGGVILLAVLVVVVTAVMSRRRRRADDGLDPGDELDQFLSTLNNPDSAAAAPIEPAMRELPSATSVNLERNRQVVSDLAGDQPDDMARLLRNWMNTKES
jgi:flagellar M-ring protein FliF